MGYQKYGIESIQPNLLCKVVKNRGDIAMPRVLPSTRVNGDNSTLGRTYYDKTSGMPVAFIMSDVYNPPKRAVPETLIAVRKEEYKPLVSQRMVGIRVTGSNDLDLPCVQSVDTWGDLYLLTDMAYDTAVRQLGGSDQVTEEDIQILAMEGSVTITPLEPCGKTERRVCLVTDNKKHSHVGPNRWDNTIIEMLRERLETIL